MVLETYLATFFCLQQKLHARFVNLNCYTISSLRNCIHCSTTLVAQAVHPYIYPPSNSTRKFAKANLNTANSLWRHLCCCQSKTSQRTHKDSFLAQGEKKKKETKLSFNSEAKVLKIASIGISQHTHLLENKRTNIFAHSVTGQTNTQHFKCNKRKKYHKEQLDNTYEEEKNCEACCLQSTGGGHFHKNRPDSSKPTHQCKHLVSACNHLISASSRRRRTLKLRPAVDACTSQLHMSDLNYFCSQKLALSPRSR